MARCPAALYLHRATVYSCAEKHPTYPATSSPSNRAFTRIARGAFIRSTRRVMQSVPTALNMASTPSYRSHLARGARAR